jgi:uncharacterized membrane protein YkvA (DUF1232 family)
MDSKLVIEFDEHDLKQLQEVFRAARMSLGEMQQGDILRACRELLQKAERAGAPGFALKRLRRMNELVSMVEDQDWNLPPEDVTRVVNALAYFANADDLIPDDVPGLGYLDDAVMVELVLRELAQELKAYDDFRKFREAEQVKRAAAGDERPVSRMDWLEIQRRKAQEVRKSKSWLPWKRKISSFLD